MNDFYNFFIKAGKNPLWDFKDKSTALWTHIFYMLARTQSMFKYDGLPDTIPARILELYLQFYGYVGVFEYKGNMYACFGGLGGVPDYNYMPTIFTVSNPALKYNANLKINEECVIVRNDSMYIGLMPMLRKYGTALLENELSMNLISINTRVQTLLSASDERTKDSALQFLKRLEDGDIGIISDLQMFENLRAMPYAGSSTNSNIKNLIEYEQYLKASEYNELGLDANYNMKRETLTDSENEMNRDALIPFIDDMYKCRVEGVEQINKMFGTDIRVSFSSAWEDNKEELELAHEIMENEAEETAEPEEPEKTEEPEEPEEIKEMEVDTDGQKESM